MEEEVLREFASHIALGAELICVLAVALGALITLVRVVISIARGLATDQTARREIFMAAEM